MSLKPDISIIGHIVEPNGTGKTTTLKILSSLVRPTSGNIYMKGMDISTDAVEIKSFLGFFSRGVSSLRRYDGR